MVHQESQAPDRDNQELHSERVVIPVICGLELEVDQVDGCVRAPNVDDLKDPDNVTGWILTCRSGHRPS